MYTKLTGTTDYIIILTFYASIYSLKVIHIY